MKYSIDIRLKPIIDELGEEYKDLLIERALDDLNEIDIDQINLSDIIRLDVQAKSTLRGNAKSQRQNRMFSMIALLGLTYAFVGLMLMMWSEFQSSIRYDPLMMMAVVLIFIGLFVALFSLLFRIMVKIHPKPYRRQRHTISSYEVLNKWKEIEALINELTPDNDAHSLSAMLANLAETKIISERDLNTINQLLKIRNQIVHTPEDSYNLSQADLRSLLMDADKTIARMKKLV